MREQVCIYMCPWPRIQAAMMDPDTITVAYRDWRGEPRGKGNLRKRERAAAQRAQDQIAAAWPGAARYGPTPYPDRGRAALPPVPRADTQGDCIDCMACVNVCPVGIDIRNGQQMECITCALCIDACDDVMAKIGKPRGLIDYLALSDETAERAGQPPKPLWRHILRPRTLLYTAAWALIGVALVYALFIRSAIELTVSPVRNPTYVTLSDGAVRNIYDVRLRNKQGRDATVQIGITSDSALTVTLEGQGNAGATVVLPANQTILQRVYVTAAPQTEASTADMTQLRLWVEDTGTGDRASKATSFNGKDR
jgi:cytochrome c oxidase accessory protein FixG